VDKVKRANNIHWGSTSGRPVGRIGRPPTLPQREGLLYPATPEGCLRGMRDLGVIQARAAGYLRISQGFLSEVLRGRARSQKALNRLATWLTARRRAQEVAGRFRPVPRLAEEVTLSDAARRLGMTRRTMFAAFHGRLLPSWFRVDQRGGRYWVSPAAVARLGKWRQAGGRNGSGSS
jgi:hypothetical protein